MNNANYLTKCKAETHKNNFSEACARFCFSQIKRNSSTCNSCQCKGMNVLLLKEKNKVSSKLQVKLTTLVSGHIVFKKTCPPVFPISLSPTVVESGHKGDYIFISNGCVPSW